MKRSWSLSIPFALFPVIFLCAALVSPQSRTPSKGNKKAQPINELTKSDQAKPDHKQVQLKLKDGTRITVDDARETEQGIWYKQSGVTYLAPRDRVAAVERDVVQQRASGTQVAKVMVVDTPASKQTNQPTWIYLVGGARVEADSADESNAGVWYRRGSLAVFIERSRIDHIEREELESVAETDPSSIKERGWSTGKAKIDSLIRQNGAKYGVDPYLIFCVMEQESHFSTRVVSPKGARGLMQLMPGTSARFGVRRPFDPAQNISAGTRYLKQLIAQFQGRVDLVLAGYNAGERTVVRFGHKVPPYTETRAYVKRISYRYRRTKVPQPSNSQRTSQAGGGK